MDQPNLRKMFDFHTTVILVVTLILISSCTTTRARLESQSKTHDQQSLSQNQNHHHHHNHNHHRHHHHQPQSQLLQQEQYHLTTPRIEEESSSTTNNPLPLIDDNELTIKEADDEVLLKANAMYSLSSSTSTPSRHHNHQFQQQQQHRRRNGQHLILTSSSLSSPTSPASSSSFSNFIVEQPHHTHHQEQEPPQQQSSLPSTRLVPTPLPALLPSYFLSAAATTITTPKYNNPSNDGGGNQRRPSSSKAAKATSPAERSKFSSHTAASSARDNYRHHQRPQYHPPQHWQEKHYSPSKRGGGDYDDYDLQLRQKPEEDYYEEYTDNDSDNDEEDDDEDDIDGFIDDTDNNLSDRSYARITRSKLDDDYADDEPYRNAVDDQMQRDAPPGVLTDQKYLEVGNEKAVQQARERYIQEQKRPRTPHELATEHWQRMIHATKCRKPLPRVIPVSNNTSKRYEPYATILHRCGEDTGCCGTTASVCTVKRQEIVMVYVFSYDFNYRKEIEALPMQNHTECHCVNRASLQYDSTPRGKRSGSWQHHRPLQIQRPPQHHNQPLVSRSDMKSQQQSQPQTQMQYHHHSENMLSCHCPRHFSALEEDVERYAHLPRPHTVFTRKCRCDCLSNNQTCLRFKHGEEGFSLEDRKCVSEHDCKPPVCAFGEYNVQTGRCPSYRSHGKPKF